MRRGPKTDSRCRSNVSPRSASSPECVLGLPTEKYARDTPAEPSATRGGTRPRQGSATEGRRTCPPRCPGRAGRGGRSRGPRRRDSRASAPPEGARDRPRRKPSGTRTRVRRPSGTRTIWSATRSTPCDEDESGPSLLHGMLLAEEQQQSCQREQTPRRPLTRDQAFGSACPIPFTNGRPRRSRRIPAFVARARAGSWSPVGSTGKQKPHVLRKARGASHRKKDRPGAGRADAKGEERDREDGPGHDSAAPGPRGEDPTEAQAPVASAIGRSRHCARAKTPIATPSCESPYCRAGSPNVKTVTRDVEKSRSDSRGRRSQRADAGAPPSGEASVAATSSETEAELEPHRP